MSRAPNNRNSMKKIEIDVLKNTIVLLTIVMLKFSFIGIMI